MKKYELVDETLEVFGKTLHRIRALKRIVISEGLLWFIEEGSLGGFIESEEISQEDNCWVGENAKVFGNVRITGKTVVSGNVYIYGNAQIKGTFSIHGDLPFDPPLKIYGDAVLETEYNGEPEDFCVISCIDSEISGKLRSTGALTIKGAKVRIRESVDIQGHDIEVIGRNINLLSKTVLKGNYIEIKGNDNGGAAINVYY